jgi:hypothetical protein
MHIQQSLLLRSIFMRNHATIALALSLLATSAGAQEQSIGSMTSRVGKDDCYAGWKNADGTTLTIGYGITDGFVGVNIDRPSWDMVEGQDTDANDHPLTIRFGDGGTTTSAVGGYKSGFTEGAWGNWKTDREGAGSAGEIWALLKQNKNASVSIDGKSLGSFEMSTLDGFAANFLESCAKRERENR